jgi:N-acylglucosamine 2-epimerase
MGAQTQAVNSLPLERLEQLLHVYLFEDFLPFMDRLVIDHEYGGFMCTVRPNGERVSDDKPIWYQGRGMWVYSFLYNNFGRDPVYLNVALNTRKLLEKSRPTDPGEMWPKGLHWDGSVASPPDHEICGDMFIAEGLAELSKATGERSTWECGRHRSRFPTRCFRNRSPCLHH